MCVLFFFSISPPTLSTLFPYTTLFRSHKVGAVGAPARRVCIRSAVARPSRTGRCGRFGIGELEVRHHLLDVAPWTLVEQRGDRLQRVDREPRLLEVADVGRELAERERREQRARLHQEVRDLRPPQLLHELPSLLVGRGLSRCLAPP